MAADYRHAQIYLFYLNLKNTVAVRETNFRELAENTKTGRATARHSRKFCTLIV